MATIEIVTHNKDGSESTRHVEQRPSHAQRQITDETTADKTVLGHVELPSKDQILHQSTRRTLGTDDTPAWLRQIEDEGLKQSKRIISATKKQKDITPDLPKRNTH